MMKFRYRLSWLLLVPVVLAGVIWWLKPPAHASYDYLASNDPEYLPRSPSFYYVQPVYLERQLLLRELKDCEFAIVYVGAVWSPTTKVNIQHLCQVSEHYQGRVPFFVCSYYYDVYDSWFSGTLVSKPGVDSYLCLVQRGVITHQFHDYLGTPEEIHVLLKRILPWNYSL